MHRELDQEPIATEPSSEPLAPTTGQKIWQWFCRFMTAIFYRRHEAAGAEGVPLRGAAIFCANHVNALVDAVVIQATCPRSIHPLARSGLFRRPLLRLILNGIQAVPIYRRSNTGEDRDVRQANRDSFKRCFEFLEDGRALLIFPEGQSHSDPMLRPLKTGAARLALGHLEHHGELPSVIPVGLTFSNKGRFRTSLLVSYGEPIPFEPLPDEDTEAQVRRYTAMIEDGLENVTLNVESWQDLELLRHLQSFFNLRGRRDRSLAERFRVLKQLIDAHRDLREKFPAEVAALAEKLALFKELCDKHGVQDYHLNLRYRPAIVLRFLLRSLFFIGLVFPIALWGVLNSFIPFWLTRYASSRAARGRDQYDTAGMLFGFLLFAFFWGAQTFAVFWFWGLWPAATVYALSLLFSGAIALLVSRERMRIIENVRVFLLFLRRGELRPYLRQKREELEVDIAQMTRLARRLT